MWVGCYSYKGGTGRTVSAANIASMFAKEGYRIGIIDLDLEAPGLDVVFGIRPSRFTVLDLLTPGTTATLELATVNVKEQLGWEISGELFLLPAARDLDKLRGVPTGTELVEILARLQRDFTEKYELDYGFIDCRSGVSDYGVLGLLNTNFVLLFFCWGRQHFIGTQRVIPILDRIPKLSALIASRIPKLRGIDQRELERRVSEFGKKELLGIIWENDELKLGERILVFDRPALAENFSNICQKIEETKKEIRLES